MKQVALIGMVSLLAAGCVPNVEQPEVRLAGARLASIGLSGGTVDVELSVYNPNDFRLRVSGLTYDLDLEDPSGDGWVDFTDGRVDRDVEVGAGDSTRVVIPVDFDYGRLGSALRGLLERGSFDYRVSGLVALEGPVQRDIRYRHSGAVGSGDIR